MLINKFSNEDQIESLLLHFSWHRDSYSQGDGSSIIVKGEIEYFKKVNNVYWVWCHVNQYQFQYTILSVFIWTAIGKWKRFGFRKFSDG